jgi:hypothetical protein
VASSLKLPSGLVDLITSERWPRVFLNRRAEIPAERVRSLFPEEDDIYLLPPRFLTVARRVREGDSFWTWPFAAPHELDPQRSVLIGDFGLGSDSPIVLDYRPGPNQPCIRYLKIHVDFASRTTENHWVSVADSFDEFATALDLPTVDWSAFRGAEGASWPHPLLLE